MASEGVVRAFDADQGWGVIDGPEVPGGCWVSFAAIAADGYRELSAGQRVSFRAEAASQDGFAFRAVKVWTGEAEPAGPARDQPSSGAYHSSLIVAYDSEEPGRRRFEVTDDSGFLALVDQHAYRGFVGPEWTYDSLFAHFREAMAAKTLLLWGTGREELWTVEVVVDEPAPAAGFRRATGPIRVSAGQLHLTNYESLTMAAQFPDVRLPEPHLSDLVIDLPAGDYRCEIVQLHDPDDDEPGDSVDFVLALTRGGQGDPWPDPPWH
jgi:cold shock CspA family protein